MISLQLFNGGNFFHYHHQPSPTKTNYGLYLNIIWLYIAIFVSTLTSRKTSSMEYLFGKKIRALREAQGLLQRQVAYHLDIDSPMLSNIERGDRRAKREWIPKLAKLLQVSEEELLTYWLADRVFDVVDNEKVAKETIKTVAKTIGLKAV